MDMFLPGAFREHAISGLSLLSAILPPIHVVLDFHVQIGFTDFESLVLRHYRRTLVLLGFSSGFANWVEVQGWVEETGRRFDRIFGHGTWLVIFE